MNKQERTNWVRVYRLEMERRRKALKKDVKAYKLIYGPNHKSLKEGPCEKGCMWVPATHVWIHDTVRKGSYTFNGATHRAFHEAFPYTDSLNQYLPQVCWNCCATRHKISPVVSYQERKTLAQQIEADRNKKPRNRKVDPNVIRDLSEILGDVL